MLIDSSERSLFTQTFLLLCGCVSFRLCLPFTASTANVDPNIRCMYSVQMICPTQWTQWTQFTKAIYFERIFSGFLVIIQKFDFLEETDWTEDKLCNDRKVWQRMEQKKKNKNRREIKEKSLRKYQEAVCLQRINSNNKQPNQREQNNLPKLKFESAIKKNISSFSVFFCVSIARFFHSLISLWAIFPTHNFALFFPFFIHSLRFFVLFHSALN